MGRRQEGGVGGRGLPNLRMGGGAGGDLSAPSGGGSRARPSPGRDRGGARDIPGREGGRSSGLAAAKVSRWSSGRPSFPGPGRGGDPRARTVSEGSGAPLFSQTPSLHCVQLGFPTWEAPRACARAPSSPPRPPPTGEQAPGRAGAETRTPRADPSPGPLLRPCRRRSPAGCALARGPAKRGPAARREVGLTRRCPRQRQVWELH